MLNLIARLAETGHQVWFGESDTVTVTQDSGESRVVLESIIATDPAAVLNLLSRYGASVKAVDDKLLIWRDENGDDWYTIEVISIVVYVMNMAFAGK